MTLKPKSNDRSRRPSNSWPLGLPPLTNVKKSWRKRNAKNLIIPFVTLCLLLLYLFSGNFKKRNVTKKPYPAVHGVYHNEIPASSNLIFPQIEHSALLKDIGVRGLYILRLESDGDKRYVLKPEEKPLSDEEKKKITSQTLLVKKSFLDHGKLVYRKSNSPETVVVTLIDFENYELDTLVSIVQNRVDYAQKHNYGVYIRWIQEFIPLLENQNLNESGSFAKSLIMRAAMHAFPNAKRFIFIDDTSLITDFKLSVENNIMNSNILDMASLKDTPVSPNSAIRTYNNLDFSKVSIVFPHNQNDDISTSTFIISNDIYSRAFIEYINDPLIKNFEWENLAHCIGHILQWHPEILAKTAMVHSKFISSSYDPNFLKTEKPDTVHYTEGDFIATFPYCKDINSCNKDITSLYNSLKENKK
ncbi:probable alpha-1,6-mannosyltransferase Mnn11p [Monosporozyma unispora]|nr:hypothetical protein C6P44_000880 [Kazachstania unispora]